MFDDYDRIDNQLCHVWPKIQRKTLFAEDGESQGSGSPPPTPDRSPNNDGE